MIFSAKIRCDKLLRYHLVQAEAENAIETVNFVSGKFLMLFDERRSHQGCCSPLWWSPFRGGPAWHRQSPRPFLNSSVPPGTGGHSRFVLMIRGVPPGTGSHRSAMPSFASQRSPPSAHPRPWRGCCPRLHAVSALGLF